MNKRKIEELSRISHIQDKMKDFKVIVQYDVWDFIEQIEIGKEKGYKVIHSNMSVAQNEHLYKEVFYAYMEKE